MRAVYEVDTIDLAIGGNSKMIPIDGKGPISIQPTLIGLVGNPTYTVEVSNDAENYVEYNKLATNVAIDDAIWIAYDVIPWMYMRIVVNRSGPDAGTVRFKLYLNVDTLNLNVS